MMNELSCQRNSKTKPRQKRTKDIKVRVKFVQIVDEQERLKVEKEIIDVMAKMIIDYFPRKNRKVHTKPVEE